MLSLSKDNPDNSIFDYKYTEHRDVVHYNKDKNAVTSSITLPSVLHRATTLASQSKAHIAESVKLDNQLKELINDDTGESKDSGGNGEA